MTTMSLVKSDSIDSETPEDLTCALCLGLLCEPCRWPALPGSTCEHVFCRLCCFKSVRAQLHPTCPLCREPACEDLKWAAASELALDEAKSEQVLRLFPAVHKTQLFQNTDELKKLQLYDSEMPLLKVGVHALRKSNSVVSAAPGTSQYQNIRFKLQREHLGLFVHVLTSPKRLVAVVLDDTAFAGAVARCGPTLQPSTPLPALSSCLLARPASGAPSSSASPAGGTRASRLTAR